MIDGDARVSTPETANTPDVAPGSVSKIDKHYLI